MESFLTFDIFYSDGIVHAINSHLNLKSKNLSFGLFFYIKYQLLNLDANINGHFENTIHSALCGN